MINSLYTALTAGGSSALASLLTCYMMRHLLKRDEEMKKKTEEELSKAKEKQWTLLEKDVKELEKKLNDHITNDKTPVIMNELKTISGNIQKVLDQQNILIQSDAEQKAQIITLFKGLKEQKNDLKECQKEHKRQ